MVLASAFKGASTLIGNLFVHPAAKALPRDPDLWAFGAPGGRFEGNSKYLYLWLNQQAQGPRPVWITTNRQLAADLRRRGFRAWSSRDPRGMLTAARAGVIFVNDNASDVHFSLTSGAPVFNLWHGVGLKNVLFGSTVGTSADLRRQASNPWSRLRSMRRLQRPHWVLSTSPTMSAEFFARCFDVPAERAPALGYPRLDPQIDDRLRDLALSFEDYSAVQRVPGMKTLLYAPTLRENGGDLLGHALPDPARLSAALDRQGARLFLKLHPKMSVGKELELPPNILLLPDQMDLYPVLDAFDGLITDYSSLFFDFIATRAEGVTLYSFDLDDYVRKERDLAWDYDDATLGTRAATFDELCEVIADGRAFQPLEPVKLRHLRERFWGGDLELPTASQRIASFVRAQEAVR